MVQDAVVFRTDALEEEQRNRAGSKRERTEEEEEGRECHQQGKILPGLPTPSTISSPWVNQTCLHSLAQEWPPRFCLAKLQPDALVLTLIATLLFLLTQLPQDLRASMQNPVLAGRKAGHCMEHMLQGWVCNNAGSLAPQALPLQRLQSPLTSPCSLQTNE